MLGTNQCVSSCPAGYAQSSASHTCIQCINPACDSCSPTNVSICYSCNSSTFWYLSDCLSLCPSATFSSGSNCTACDISCANCTGAPTPCSLCNTGYKLSGTTCASSCLAQYGSTSDPLVCVLCDAKCTTCYQTSTNCSACTTSAPNEAYLLGGNQCVSSCPPSYRSDTLTHNCQACTNSLCISCPSSVSSCDMCLFTAFWMSFDCFSSCPSGFYSSGTNCSACDSSCS